MLKGNVVWVSLTWIEKLSSLSEPRLDLHPHFGDTMRSMTSEPFMVSLVCSLISETRVLSASPSHTQDLWPSSRKREPYCLSYSLLSEGEESLHRSFWRRGVLTQGPAVHPKQASNSRQTPSIVGITGLHRPTQLLESWMLSLYLSQGIGLVLFTLQKA